MKKENEFKKQQAIMRLNADPFDVEAQKEIEEMVRMENVNANLDQVISQCPLCKRILPCTIQHRHLIRGTLQLQQHQFGYLQGCFTCTVLTCLT